MESNNLLLKIEETSSTCGTGQSIFLLHGANERYVSIHTYDFSTNYWWWGSFGNINLKS